MSLKIIPWTYIEKYLPSRGEGTSGSFPGLSVDRSDRLFIFRGGVCLLSGDTGFTHSCDDSDCG